MGPFPGTRGSCLFREGSAGYFPSFATPDGLLQQEGARGQTRAGRDPADQPIRNDLMETDAFWNPSCTNRSSSPSSWRAMA